MPLWTEAEDGQTVWFLTKSTQPTVSKTCKKVKGRSKVSSYGVDFVFGLGRFSHEKSWSHDPLYGQFSVILNLKGVIT